MKLSNSRTIKTDIGMFVRALETLRHIYFVCYSATDKKHSVQMYNRKRKLLYDDELAYEALKADIDGSYAYLATNKLKEHLEVSK